MTVDELHGKVQNLLPKNAPIRGFIELVNLCVEKVREVKGFWNHYQKASQLLLIDAYSTGTVDVTQDSATVTGNGTTFTSAMVGRKFTAGGSEVYEIATYVSGTEITITPVYQGDTDTAIAYEVYQDAYELPADCESLIGWWDATNQYYVKPSASLEVMNRSVLMQGTASFPYQGAQFGVGANGYPEVIFYPPPKTRLMVPIWYGRKQTEVTAVGDSIDTPAALDSTLVAGMRWLCSETLPDVSPGNLEHWRNRFYEMRDQKWAEDQATVKYQRVTMPSAMGFGGSEPELPLTLSPIIEG